MSHAKHFKQLMENRAVVLSVEHGKAVIEVVSEETQDFMKAIADIELLRLEEIDSLDELWSL